MLTSRFGKKEGFKEKRKRKKEKGRELRVEGLSVIRVFVIRIIVNRRVTAGELSEVYRNLN